MRLKPSCCLGKALLSKTLRVPSAVPSEKKKVGPWENGPPRANTHGLPLRPTSTTAMANRRAGCESWRPPPTLQPPSNTFPYGCLYTITVLEVAAPSRSTFAGSRHSSYRMDGGVVYRITLAHIGLVATTGPHLVTQTRYRDKGMPT